MTPPSNGPWVLVDIDFQDACEHFDNSLVIFTRGGFEKPGIDGYAATMALMHSMQCGYTSLENGLVKLLRLLGEPFIQEGQWHHDLIVQCGADTADRVAILEKDLVEHAQTTRAFRNVATRRYHQHFDPGLAQGAVRAGAILSSRLPACLKAFKQEIDPPDQANDGGGGGRL